MEIHKAVYYTRKVPVGLITNEGSGLLRVSGMLCESKCEVASLVLAASSEGRRKSGDKIWEGKRGKYCL